MSSRFDFPGFVLGSSDDTDNHEIETGTIICGGQSFQVTLMRHKDFLHSEFRPSKIMLGGKQVWSFKDQVFEGHGLLAQAGDDIVIALIGKASSAIDKIVSFSSLAGGGALTVDARIDMKVAAATFLDCRPVLTDIERRFSDIRAARARLAREAEQQEQLQQKLQRRLQRRGEILGRETVTMETFDGQQRYGHPVIEGEWQCLESGTYVVLVDDKGLPIESFIVKTGDGKPPRKFAAKLAVSDKVSTLTQKVTPALPQSIGTELFELGDDAYEISVYTDMNAIRAHRAAGMNGGTKVAVPLPEKGKYALYAVRHDGIDTLGKFAAMV